MSLVVGNSKPVHRSKLLINIALTAVLQDEVSMVNFSIGDSNTTDIYGDEDEFRRLMDEEDDGESTEKEDHGQRAPGAKDDNEDDEDDDSDLTSLATEYGGYQSSDTGFTDPPMPAATRAPGPGYRAEIQEQTSEFLRRWNNRVWNGEQAEIQDRYFLKHAVRWGMSAAAIVNTDILQTGRRDEPGVIYRIRLLKGEFKDMRPRTRQTAWKEYQRACNGPQTPLQLERENLIQAIKNGRTLDEIVQSRIVKLSTNTRAAIRHRWDTFLREGMTLPAVR